MSVFDDIERPDSATRPQDESDFDYLNRSDRIEAGRVRSVIDAWISHYPAEHREGIVRRLRSTIDGAHRSAFFELLLHELLIQHGHLVIEIEPTVPGTSRRPDFLAETPDGARYYLEAVVARGLTDAEVGAERRLNSALRAIDDTPSPRHFLDLRVKGKPTANVSINDLRRRVRGWIATLPEGDAAKTAAPFHFEQHGMSITLTAWPRQNPGQRSIGVRHFGAGVVTRAEDIGAVVEFKARRYGKSLNLPLLVAVSGFENFRYDDDALDVLLGTEIIATQRKSDGTMATRVTRGPDGVWHGPDGPRRGVNSGAWWFKQIDAWNFAARDPLLIANPWADKPMPTMNLGLRELHFGNNGPTELPGGRLGEALGLPLHWPEG